jgi:L,D-transpeptidase catalytic domain
MRTLKLIAVLLLASCVFATEVSAQFWDWRANTQANSSDTSEPGSCPQLPPRQLRLTKQLPSEDPCDTRGTSLVALTGIKVLFLCKDGKSVANYDLSLGRGGLGKRLEGDLKTPIGSYSLSQPRRSADFHLFIPVGYPNKTQKENGYTGGDIGVHGPTRLFRCGGFLNVSFNWTQGCLAVADDSFIEEIAKFVKTSGADRIHILK